MGSKKTHMRKNVENMLDIICLLIMFIITPVIIQMQTYEKEKIEFLEYNKELKLKKLAAIERHLKSVEKLTKEVAELEREKFQPSLFEN